MKKFNTVLISLICFVTLFAGCSNPLSTKTSEKSETGYTEVSFNLVQGGAARTAVADYNWADFTYYLSAIPDYDASKQQDPVPLVDGNNSYTNYEQGKRKLLQGKYKFILEGFKDDDVIIKGETVVELKEKTQVVTFVMYPCEGLKGQLDVVIKYDGDGVIQVVKADVFDNRTGIPASECAISSTTEDDKILKIAKYTNNNLDSAKEQYLVVNCFDAQGSLVFDYAESLNIVGGYKSTSTIHIKPIDYYRNTAVITITKDGNTWGNSPEKIIFIDKNDPEKKYELSGSNGVFEGSVPDGVYDVVIPGSPADVNTGITYDTENGLSKEPVNVVTVTLPADKGLNYTPQGGVINSSGNDYIVPEGSDFEVKVEIAAGYEKPEDNKVTIGGNDYTFEADKDYIENVVINSGNGGSADVEKVVPIVYTITYDVTDSIEKVVPAGAKTSFTIEETVTFPTTGLTKENCVLAGWTINNAGTTVKGFLAGDYKQNITVKPVWVGNGNANYTVKILEENIADAGYTLKDTVILHGAIGEPVPEYDAESKTGFKTPVIKSNKKNVEADGSTVVTVEYERQEYTINFNANGGKFSGSETGIRTGKYGATVAAPANPSREDYSFNEWSATIPATFAENLTINALWTQKYAKFKIQTWFENIADDEYSQNLTDYPDTESKGAIGTNATATHVEITGFSRTVDYPVISPDGDTIVKIYYKRNRVTLTFAGNGGTFAGEETGIRTGKFGATVSKPANPSRNNYAFTGWSPSVPGTFPAVSATYTAQWNQTVASYNVEWYTEDESGNMVRDKLETLSGEIGSTPVVTAPEKKGFTATVTTTPVTADDTDVQKVEYKRNTITYTFKLAGGNIAGNTADYVISGKYGSAVAEDDMKDPSFESEREMVFQGWTAGETDDSGKPIVYKEYPSTYETSKTYTAVWYSEVSGIGHNPLIKDIEISGITTAGKVVSAALKLPYVGKWSYYWYVDGTLDGYVNTVTESDKTQTITTSALSNKKHTIVVIAIEAGDNGLPAVTFTKEFEVSIGE